MTMPKQKPGKSEQVVGTPPEFVDAVERVFGPIAIDLAALQSNAVGGHGYYGPDHAIEGYRDSLAADWSLRNYTNGIGFLNPPYSNIAPWAKKCADWARSGGGHVLMLVPASIGANWWDAWVTPFADVYVVGRMKFVGHETGFPKDLALCHFWELGGGKTKRWRWEK